MNKTEIFINKVVKTNHGKYDYSLVNYINNRTNVIIVCPEHGVFNQRPDSHIMGKGCPICSKSKKLTQEEYNLFISKIQTK